MLFFEFIFKRFVVFDFVPFRFVTELVQKLKCTREVAEELENAIHLDKPKKISVIRFWMSEFELEIDSRFHLNP